MTAAQDHTRSASAPPGRRTGDAIAVALITVVALGITREHLTGNGQRTVPWQF